MKMKFKWYLNYFWRENCYWFIFKEDETFCVIIEHCAKTQEEKTKECFQIPNCQNFYKFFTFFSKVENWTMKKMKNDML